MLNNTQNLHRLNARFGIKRFLWHRLGENSFTRQQYMGGKYGVRLHKKRDGYENHPAFYMYAHACKSVIARRVPRFQLGEEIVALIVYEDEGGEVFYPNFPHSFHTNLWEFHALDALNRV